MIYPDAAASSTILLSSEAPGVSDVVWTIGVGAPGLIRAEVEANLTVNNESRDIDQATAQSNALQEQVWLAGAVLHHSMVPEVAELELAFNSVPLDQSQLTGVAATHPEMKDQQLDSGAARRIHESQDLYRAVNRLSRRRRLLNILGGGLMIGALAGAATLATEACAAGEVPNQPIATASASPEPQPVNPVNPWTEGTLAAGMLVGSAGAMRVNRSRKYTFAHIRAARMIGRPQVSTENR